MSEDNEMDIPSEILEDLQSFHESLKEMQDMVHPLTTTNVNSLDVELPSLDKARLNLISGYALNSLYWMYLNTLGEDPKHHRIKTELERYKSFMQSVKEITDKDKAPVLNKGAAKRFLRNALWEPSADKGSNETERLQHMNKPSCSAPVVMEKDPNSDPQGIELSKNIKIEHDAEMKKKMRKKKKLHKKRLIKLTETELSALFCGVCSKSAVQLKRRGRFPVFMPSCKHLFCGPCLWREKTSRCPTCQQPLMISLEKPMFLA